MMFYVENAFLRLVAFGLNLIMSSRLLLVQVTSTRLTRVNNRMYLTLTRIQARGELQSGMKSVLLKMMEQIGFPQKPSLALEASSDGSAFVSLSIYSYIEKVALFFLPLVTFMDGMSETSTAELD